MKLTATAHNTTYTIETDHDDLIMPELLEYFQRLALVMSYHPKSWDDAVCAMADEIKDT